MNNSMLPNHNIQYDIILITRSRRTHASVMLDLGISLVELLCSQIDQIQRTPDQLSRKYSPEKHELVMLIQI